MSNSNLEREMFNRQQDIELYKFEFAIIIGVGGIGSWVALNMALTGNVTNMFLIDPDTIESSNLNRTPFRFCDIGQPKVVALKYLILERRAVNIEIYQQKTNAALATEIADKTIKVDRYASRTNKKQISNNGVIVDCRDDVYTDMYDFPYKYYKVGYDGLSITIDGNPRNTAVWGRANGYRHTPSFICPAQLAANLVVTDILTMKDSDETNENETDTVENVNAFDNSGRLNKVVTFDVKDLVEMIYHKVNP